MRVRLSEEVQEQLQQLEAEKIACKQLLSNTDYLAIKHADGVLSDEEYASDKAKRDVWRAKINEIEAQEAQLKQGE